MDAKYVDINPCQSTRYSVLAFSQKAGAGWHNAMRTGGCSALYGLFLLAFKALALVLLLLAMETAVAMLATLCAAGASQNLAPGLVYGLEQCVHARQSA